MCVLKLMGTIKLAKHEKGCAAALAALLEGRTSIWHGGFRTPREAVARLSL